MTATDYCYTIVYMKTLSVAEVRTSLRELLDDVERTHERVAITRYGKTSAVLISADDLESLEETLDIMGDPELVAAIAEGLAEAAAGNTFSLEEVAAELRAQGRLA